MNGTLVKMIVAAILLAGLLLALACGSGTGNGNDQNGANTAALSDSSVEIAGQDPACDDTGNMNTMRDHVNTAIDKKIKGELRKQLGHSFTYEVSVAPDGKSLEMVVRGALGDVHNANNTLDYDNFTDLMNIAKNFVRKKCTSKVTFFPAIQTTAGDRDGFVWFACEDPTRPCSDGRCDTNCNKSDNRPDLKSTSPSNSDTNSTSNSNANSGSRNKSG